MYRCIIVFICITNKSYCKQNRVVDQIGYRILLKHLRLIETDISKIILIKLIIGSLLPIILSSYSIDSEVKNIKNNNKLRFDSYTLRGWSELTETDQVSFDPQVKLI